MKQSRAAVCCVTNGSWGIGHTASTRGLSLQGTVDSSSRQLFSEYRVLEWMNLHKSLTATGHETRRRLRQSLPLNWYGKLAINQHGNLSSCIWISDSSRSMLPGITTIMYPLFLGCRPCWSYMGSCLSSLITFSSIILKVHAFTAQHLPYPLMWPSFKGVSSWEALLLLGISYSDLCYVSVPRSTQWWHFTWVARWPMQLPKEYGIRQISQELLSKSSNAAGLHFRCHIASK